MRANYTARMKIDLFIPCFVDQMTPQVGMAVVRVLERLGHTCEFRTAQTCCGQPSFNSGFWDEARQVARHALDVFAGAEAVVGPSGSCVAMLRVFYPQLLAGTPQEQAANDLAARTYEFGEFLVRGSASRTSAPAFRTASPTTTAATACASCGSRTSRAGCCGRSATWSEFGGQPLQAPA